MSDLLNTYDFAANGQTGADMALETNPLKVRGGTGQAARITIPVGASNSGTLSRAERSLVVPAGVTSLTLTGWVMTDFANCSGLGCDSSIIDSFGDGVVGIYVGPNSGGNAATTDSDPDSGDGYKLLSVTRSVTAGQTIYWGFGWTTGAGRMVAA